MLLDADCGFCMRTGRLVPHLRLRVDLSTVQATDLSAYGVDPVRAVAEMPYVHPDGRVEYGHRAWAAALRAGPWPCRLAGRLLTSAPVDPVAARVYGWVAANRHRLPGGTPACSLEDR